jgi:hypothetical protein
MIRIWIWWEFTPTRKLDTDADVRGPDDDVPATLANHACTHTRRSTPCAFQTQWSPRGGEDTRDRGGASQEAQAGANDVPRRRGRDGGGGNIRDLPELHRGEDLRRRRPTTYEKEHP